MPLSFLEAEHLRISRESAEFSAPKGFARTKRVLLGRPSGLTKPSGQSLRNPSSAEFPALGKLSGIGPEARLTGPSRLGARYRQFDPKITFRVEVLLQ